MIKQGPAAVFVAVYVPFTGTAEPKAEVKCSDLGGGTVALRIDIADDRFLVIHASKISRLDYEGLSLDGRVGVACWKGGNLESLTLGDGRALEYGAAGIFRSTVGDGFRSQATAETH